MNIHRDIMKSFFIIGLLCIQFVLLDPSAVFSQNNTVNGVVSDANTGETLPGVNIALQGTNSGTSTDVQGHYSLTVPSLNDTLTFSFIGYQTRKVPINGRRQIDVSLKPQAFKGQELVVVGYGTQKQKNITGSIATVSTEDLRDIPVAGYEQALAGQMAGVQVNTANGRPGGGANIRIRGIGSIGAGNSPLVVVDGFPVSAFDVPPDEIKSIDVLKDASATAIYGSRGANGVILVTTKGGTSTTQIQVNSSLGLQSVRQRGMVDVLNAHQFATFMKERISDNIRFNEGREPTPQDIPEMYRNPGQYGEGTNWRDEIFQKALMTKQYFSVSGGSEKVRSRLSADFIDQRGTLLETGYKRYNLKLDVNADLSNKLKVGLKLAPSLDNRRFGGSGGGRTGPIGSAYLVNPIAPVRNPDGSLAAMIDGPGLLAFPNPVLRLKEEYSTVRNRRGRAIVNAFAEYELTQGLTIKSSIDINWQSNESERFKPTTIGGFNTYPPTAANASHNTSRNIDWQNKNTVNYETNFGNHNIKVLAGFTEQKNTVRVGSFNATDFPDNEIRTFNAASTITGDTYTSEWGLLSGLARVNYDYKNKYLVTATVRRDGSSRFGSDNKWGTFPSFSIGWRISDENFMNNIKKIDNLLLRVGYGKSGNFNIGNYSHLGTVNTTNYALNSQLIPGRSITNLGNPDLGWEEVKQLDIGLDLSMFQSRLNITADYYDKVTSKMLLNIETPYTSGFASTITNRGEVTNKGVELAVRSTVVNNSSFSWNINFNVAHNSNKVTSLDSRILSPAGTAQHITEEGYPPGQFFGFVIEGFYSNEEDIKNSPSYPGAIPGSYKFKDVNGDGRIDPVTDFARLGDPYPDFTGGLTNALRYKNLDLSISLTGSYGGEILQTGREDFWNLDGVFNVSTEALNRWRSPENPGNGKIPRAISQVIHRYNNSGWVDDNSNIWIRDITLGYRFSPGQYEFLNLVGAKDLRIYFNIHNAWISNTNFQNPEVSLNPNDPLQPGETRNTNYPISRIFTFGLNINL